MLLVPLPLLRKPQPLLRLLLIHSRPLPKPRPPLLLLSNSRRDLILSEEEEEEEEVLQWPPRQGMHSVTSAVVVLARRPVNLVWAAWRWEEEASTISAAQCHSSREHLQPPCHSFKHAPQSLPILQQQVVSRG